MFYNMHFIFHSLRHIIYTFIAINKMKQENQYAFLQFIDPPPNYPPSEYEICTQIQSKFYSECMHFLKSQKKLYECSKKIEKRLNNSLADSTSLDQWIKINQNKLEKITKQLRKINCHYVDAEQKQQFLGSICKFINMEQAKKILLSNKINDEDQFMEKIRQIAFLAEEIKDLKSDAKVIVQIKQQMSSLLQETVNKLIKGSISDNFLKRITSDVSEPFLKDPKVSTIFIKNLIHQRLNFFRVGLNPLINNLNYVQNVTELYQKIVEEWLKMLQCQSEIFCRPEVPQQLKIISREVLIKLSPQVLPKMERGIYKVKSLIDLSKMRCSFLKLKSKLEQYGQGSWEGLAKIILKVSILIEQKLQQEAEQIEIAKYNIYSLVSYVPIRQHLQIIKEAKIYDPNNGQMNWERGFKKLADSRDPSKQPNNKSLIIFNLNIWFLYSHIMKEEGQLIKRAEEMTKQCSNLIVNVNSQQMKKQYEAKSFQKLIDICADYQNIKKNLFSEINLLHHERLRSSVERVLRSKFIQQIYVPILKQNNVENGLNNGQTVELAKKQKINLNKYGKLSENLRIFTSEEMKSLLA